MQLARQPLSLLLLDPQEAGRKLSQRFLRVLPFGDLVLQDTVHFGELLRSTGDPGFQLGVGEPQFGFGPLALDELADLPAEGRHHLEQCLVGLADLAAEKCHDAVDFLSEKDWKAHGRAQSQF